VLGKHDTGMINDLFDRMNEDGFTGKESLKTQDARRIVGGESDSQEVQVAGESIGEEAARKQSQGSQRSFESEQGGMAKGDQDHIELALRNYKKYD